MVHRRGLGNLVAAILLAAAIVIPSIAYILQRTGDSEHGPTSTLKIGFLEKVDSLNPYVGVNGASSIYYGFVYDCLTSLDENLKVVPNLATSWHIVPANDPVLLQSGEPYGSVWEYRLTQNASFSDGVVFNADTAVWNININAENPDSLWAFEPYSYFIHFAEKTSPFTMRIHFYDRSSGQPMPYAFGDRLFIPMLPSHKLRNMSAYDLGFKWTGVFDSGSPKVVGTGIYIPTESTYDDWIGGDHLTLMRNPNYHWQYDKGQDVQTHFDRLEMQFFDDPVAMQLAIKNRFVDLAELPQTGFNSLRTNISRGIVKSIEVSAVSSAEPRMAGLTVNGNFLDHTSPAEIDPAVRTAINLATDREEFVRDSLGGYGKVGSTIVPSSLAEHYEPSASELITLNLAKANLTLERAGYVDVDGDGIREVTNRSLAWNGVNESLELSTMIARSDQLWVGVLDPIAADLAEVGIKLDIRVYDPAIYPLTMSADYSSQYGDLLFYSGHVGDSLATLFWESNMSGYPATGILNPTFEENFTRAISELDETDREASLDNCQRALYLESAEIVLAYPDRLYAWRADTTTGWGNWTEQPGMSIDNSFGASPLLFHLRDVPIAHYSLTSPVMILTVVLVAAALVTIVVSRRRTLDKG